MLKSNRITLLVIPEEGGKTFEFKIPRLLLWFTGLLGIALCGLLLQGFRSYFDVHELDQLVDRLERDKALLKEEVGQIEQLEAMLLRLKRSNDQLRTILGESQELDAGTSQRADEEVPYISSIQRLRWGQVQPVPPLWPLRGQVLRRFNDEMPSVFIAAAVGGRAGGADGVRRGARASPAGANEHGPQVSRRQPAHFASRIQLKIKTRVSYDRCSRARGT